MRLIKILLVLLLLIAAVLFGGGMLLSPKFSVTRSIEVQAAPAAVYARVADPREWRHWSPWNRRDPVMQMSFSGAASGAGAGWAWRSQTQGNGRMAFVAAEPPHELAYELHFVDFESTATGTFRIEAIDNGASRVTWVMNGDTGSNPLMRWFALGAGPMVGDDFEAGLRNLKTLVEQR